MAESILDELTPALRKELRQRIDEHAKAQKSATSELGDSDEWAQLDSGVQQSILTETNLVSEPVPDISTERGLLDALDAMSLKAWDDRISLIPSRRDQAHERAAKLLEPESVSVTPAKATLRSEPDLDAYLAGVRDQVLPHLKKKKIVII